MERRHDLPGLRGFSWEFEGAGQLGEDGVPSCTMPIDFMVSLTVDGVVTGVLLAQLQKGHVPHVPDAATICLPAQMLDSCR
jgi:hypothetical protein